jgi:hypothetical protein
VDRLVKLHERQGRPDLALLVFNTDGSSVRPVDQHVTVALMCRASIHDRPVGPRVVVEIHLDTDPRFPHFERAWGNEEDGRPGLWQKGAPTLVLLQPGGYRKVRALCPACERPVTINATKLRNVLEEMWAPGAQERREWG